MFLASEDDAKQSPAEQIYYLYKMEEEKKFTLRKQTLKRNILNTLIILIGYMAVYFIGRIIWCDLSENTLIGWIFTARSTGEHSYLYGWLLSSSLFWYALAISAVPSLWGKFKFSVVTTTGFIVGIIAGMIFGPYPEGAAIGHDHYGWAIWEAIYLISVAVVIIAEKYKKKVTNKQAE